MNQVELENLTHVSPIDGAAEVLGALKSIGIKVGVITRSHRDYAVKALDISGLLQFIDCIVSRKLPFTTKSVVE